MTDQPLKLVTAPPIADEIRCNIVNFLRELLSEAEGGQISALLVIAERDGHWGHDSCQMRDFPRAIGQIEIVKARLTASYLGESEINQGA